MALSEDIIKANQALSTLTPEQISAIASLSLNDEAAVIGKKTGEIYGNIEKDVIETSGFEKKQGEKAYEFVKRVITDFKVKAESSTDIQNQITALQAERAELMKQISEGNTDPLIKQQLRDAQSELSAFKQKALELETEVSETKSKYAKEVSSIKLDAEIDKTLAGFAFNSTISENVRNLVIENAKGKLKAYSSAMEQDLAGNTVLVFRDADGEVIRDATSRLPITIQSVMSTELKDIIDVKKQPTGLGGNPKGGGGPDTGTLDLSEHKNQISANKAVSDYLLKKGVLRTSPDFAREMAKIRTENRIAELPIQ